MFPGWKRGCSIVEIHPRIHPFSFDTASVMDFCLNLNRNLIVICLLGMFEVDCGTKSPSTNIIVTIDVRIYSLCRVFIVSVLCRTYDFHICTCWILNLERPLRIEWLRKSLRSLSTTYDLCNIFIFLFKCNPI